MPGPQEKSAFVGLILWGLPAEFCSCKGLIFHRLLDLGHKGFIVLLVIHLISLPKLQHILSSFSHVYLLWAVPSFDLSLSKSMNPGATTKCSSITTVHGKRKCTNTGVDSVFYSGLSLIFPPRTAWLLLCGRRKEMLEISPALPQHHHLGKVPV